ncbi:MAG TPA: peptide chain release factor 2 [Candidatus Dormibacteraeota bacterium]|nr:peptide chain release factor 2 [Candidatus Dormibacteraeota bacterium]
MMENYSKRIDKLKSDVLAAFKKLKLDSVEDKLKILNAKTKTFDFWKDNLKAQEIMKQISSYELELRPWQKLRDSINELEDWINTRDTDSGEIIENLLDKSEEEYRLTKKQLKFNGQYDKLNTIISIYAGAGGTDAQDWAQILLRMYLRYAEKCNFNVNILDQSLGDTAGLKSVTFELDGPFSYGILKNENGVHRLVRLSPFNADNLRQTSFAKVEVLPKIDQSDTVVIDDKDLRVDVFRSGGKGGQSVNTTDSAVRITHVPTNIVVNIQNERSQNQNRELAMTILRSKLTQLKIEQHQSNMQDIKGPNLSAEWGNQIRSYVMHPYKQVKDLRSKYETSNVDAILDGNLDEILEYNVENIAVE